MFAWRAGGATQTPAGVGEVGRQPLLELNRPLELFRLLRSGLQVFGGVREGSSGIFTFIVAQYVLSFG